MGRLGRGKKARIKNVLPKYRIFIEGESEYYYFCALKTNLRQCGKIIDPRKPSGGRSKTSLVNEAINTIKYEGIGNGDKTFVVFDVDSSSNPANDQQQIQKAIKLAQHNNIICIINNDSFELWLLLHFTNQISKINRQELEEKLIKELNKHYKNKKFAKPWKNLYPLINGSHELLFNAIRRAKKLKTNQNPSTNMWILIEDLYSETNTNEQSQS